MTFNIDHPIQFLHPLNFGSAGGSFFRINMFNGADGSNFQQGISGNIILRAQANVTIGGSINDFLEVRDNIIATVGGSIVGDDVEIRSGSRLEVGGSIITSNGIEIGSDSRLEVQGSITGNIKMENNSSLEVGGSVTGTIYIMTRLILKRGYQNYRSHWRQGARLSKTEHSTISAAASRA